MTSFYVTFHSVRVEIKLILGKAVNLKICWFIIW